MASITIDSNVLSAYNLVSDKSKEISMVIKNGMCYFYSEYQEVVRYSKSPIISSCEFSTTLSTEILGAIMKLGLLQISVVQSDKQVYRFVLVDTVNNKVLYSVNTILQVCLHEARIRQLSKLDTNNSQTLRDRDRFFRACELTKVNDKSLNQKGMIFADGYAWTIGNGYLIYLVDPNRLNFVASVATLRALQSLKGDSMSFCSDNGYNYCLQGNSILGWRKERKSSKLPLDYLKYEFSTEANFDRVLQLLDSIKSEIERVTLSVTHGTVTIYSLLGTYIVPIECETYEAPDFFLSPVILRSILKDCKGVIKLKYSNSRIELECSAVHYVISGLQY